MARLINSVINKLEQPTSGAVLLFDDESRGFGLRLTRGAKTYIVQCRVNGKVKRITIGRHGVFSPQQAQKEAKRSLGLMAQGIDPDAQKAEAIARAVRLTQLYERYKGSHQLKPKTISVYDGVMRRCFADWQPKPVTDITKDMVEKRHRELSNAFGPRGKGEAQAHQAMRILRALFNYAEAILEDASGKPIVAHNPVKRLTQIKAWNKIPRRQSVIDSRDLSKWFGAVNQLQSDTARDFFILLLFTGLRRSEAATLTWKQIDLDLQTLTITSEIAKNHREHRLPLTDFLVDLLAARRAKYAKQSEYVFPGLNGEAYFKEPKSAINVVITKSGIKFSCHDLRRTFITIAESLGIPHYAFHKDGSDVTAGYIVTEVERLRAPMQRITDSIRERIKQAEQSPEVDSAGA
jgi:integrase